VSTQGEVPVTVGQVVVKFGPRAVGPHGNVWDFVLTLGDIRYSLRCLRVHCEDCGMDWPEGGEYPQSCT
jgi:hypothetical protein